MSWYNFASIEFKEEEDCLIYNNLFCKTMYDHQDIIELSSINLFKNMMIAVFEPRPYNTIEEALEQFDKDLSMEFTLEFATFSGNVTFDDEHLFFVFNDKDKENKQLLSKLYNQISMFNNLYQQFEVYF